MKFVPVRANTGKLLAIMNTSASPSPNASTPELEQVEPSNPWRPLLIPAIVVIVGLGICWALFAHFGRAKPDATGKILRETAYPVQINAAQSQPDSGMAGTVPQQNETIVLVDARITNIGPKPLTIFDMTADMKLNGNSNRSFAALPEDVDRVFERFPNLAAMRTKLLTRHLVIAPGQSAEGMMVFNYAWSPQQWAQRKKPHLTVSFQNGRSLILPLQ